MITLGIDVGTTHTKVLALDLERAATLATEAAPTPVRSTSTGAAHPPHAVLQLVIELSSRVIAALPDASAVAAISVASVGEEVVLVDGAGAPLADAIAWYDRRGFDEARAFLEGPGAETSLLRRWPPDRSYSLFKLLWMRDHTPDAMAAAAGWTDLGDFVLHGLGGDLVMDWSHASRAGAFDLWGRSWDEETIEAARLHLAWPRLVPSGSVIGMLDAELAHTLGMSARVALVSGGHDHLVAAYGAGVRSTRELFLSAGTSEAHVALLDEPLEVAAAGGIDQGCYVDDRAWYAHVNIHSGHFYAQWRGLLYEGTSEQAMYAELERADSGSVRFELTGDLRLGNLAAVPYDAGRDVLLRAILEGLARRSAHIIDRLEAASGGPYDLVLAAGHPTRIPLWRSLRQAAYARPMASVDEAEPTAFGAAALAARALYPDGARDVVAARSDWT